MRDWASIERVEQLRALAHPLRLELLKRLTAAEATVGELARELGEAHARVFYHIKELEKTGLVRLVREATVRGIREKYYQAIARTLFVGQCFGKAPDVALLARQTVDDEMLRWRRQQVLEIDTGRLARELVTERLEVGAGDRVLIEGDRSQADLMEALALHCRLVGGEAVISSLSAEYLTRLLRELPADQLKEPPPFTAFLMREIDCLISIHPAAAEAKLREMAPERLEAATEGELAAWRQGRAFRSVKLFSPSRAWAHWAGADFLSVYDAFWQALLVPPEELEAEARKWQARLSGSPVWRLQSPNGSDHQVANDLRMVIDRTQFFASVGRLRPWRDHHLANLTLPDGSVTIGLDQAVGQVVSADGAMLKIDNGRVVEITAPAGGAMAPGWSGLVGKAVVFISIGLNRALTTPSGDRRLDRVGRGRLCLGIGGNEAYGGRIGGPLAYDLILSDVVLKQDG
ncbi:MAG: helix-turn-helix domain-containing protein [Bacillota bacterium]